MIKNFWYIGDKSDFSTSRSGRVGASDVPAIIQDPENPTDSLAGYERTALTVYQEKSGEVPRSFDSNYNTEMGHHNENKSLEWLIRAVFSHEEGIRFRLAKERYEADVELAKLNKTPVPSARDYQTGGPFLHSVQYYIDGMIAHPDMVFIGIPELKGKKERFRTYNGVKFDLSKPFLVEGKSAKKYAAKRPDGSMVKGYNLDLMTWQGIPLKHYMQIQFQLALFEVPVCYLALIHDTSDFQVWKIDSDRKTQGNIMDIVGKMVKHIELKTMPRELAMNGADVQTMYPDIQKDFISLSGEALKKFIEACKSERNADRQIKNWTKVQKDAKNAIAVRMKDFEEVRDGSDKLAVWTPGATGDKLACSIKDLKKNYPARYRSMLKAGLIKPSRDYRYVSVKYREGDE